MTCCSECGKEISGNLELCLPCSLELEELDKQSETFEAFKKDKPKWK